MAPEITVFYWQGSPWSAKVVSYLALRGLPYTECHQPITLPRPILNDLGVNYRRVPVLAIGKDFYVDSLLILQKIEALFPHVDGQRQMHGQNNNERALEKLLEKWTDAVVFGKAADCIPLDHPLVVDPGFIKDRTELWGEDWSQSERAKKRPEGLVQMRDFFAFLENTLLSDGREWILGGKDITIADIHSAWIFNWMISLESFPNEIASAKVWPRVFAWCERYTKVIAEAEKSAKKEVIEGPEAIKRIEAADFGDNVVGVDSADPLGLKEGQEVAVCPTDTGFGHKDQGPLVAVTRTEIVIGGKTKNGVETRIHAPRWNFKVVPAGQSSGST